MINKLGESCLCFKTHTVLRKLTSKTVHVYQRTYPEKMVALVRSVYALYLAIGFGAGSTGYTQARYVGCLSIGVAWQRQAGKQQL